MNIWTEPAFLFMKYYAGVRINVWCYLAQLEETEFDVQCFDKEELSVFD